ncbi:MAG: chromosome partitioning protein ParA [Desulfovibrionales bacterium]|nr:MAG: chromosome partitioning protein ParA [Desulfovibrionales bacterium]
MIIECSNCHRKLRLDENLIPDHPVRLRCSSCGNSFQYEKSKNPTENSIQESEQKTRKIGVSLSKGGVGKTTTAVNLAAGCALAGYKVLLVDTDTQGQAAYMLGVKPPGGLAELMTQELRVEEALFQARENLWLLAGGKSLAGVKRMIDRKDFGAEHTLSETLAGIDGRYDFVIVDTSPGWDALTVNVLFYINELLVPVSLEIMTIQALGSFFKNLGAIKKYHAGLNIKYIVPNFMDMRVKKKSETILEKLESLYKDKLCEPIRYNNVISQAPMYGKTIYEYAPGAKGAQDYRELVRKVTGQPHLFQ